MEVGLMKECFAKYMPRSCIDEKKFDSLEAGLAYWIGAGRWRTFCFGRRLSVDDFVVVTLTSLERAIVAPLLAAYFSRFFYSYYYFYVLSFTFCNLLRYVIKINKLNEDTQRITTSTTTAGNNKSTVTLSN